MNFAAKLQLRKCKSFPGCEPCHEPRLRLVRRWSGLDGQGTRRSGSQDAKCEATSIKGVSRRLQPKCTFLMCRHCTLEDGDGVIMHQLLELV